MKAPLRFFNHVKVKKSQDLREVMEEESMKPCTSNVKGYSIKIFRDRIELVADKNAKKLPIKKIKFSKVERIIPSEDTRCIYMGCRSGRGGTVTSFGFTEESVFSALINSLALKRGLVVDSESPGSESVNSYTPLSTGSKRNQQGDNSILQSLPYSGITGSKSHNYTTSYVLWDEDDESKPIQTPEPVYKPASAGLELKFDRKVDVAVESSDSSVDQRPVVIRHDPPIEQEVKHCPCCLRNTGGPGVSLEVTNPVRKVYAPSSVDCGACSYLPTFVAQSRKSFRPLPESESDDLTSASDASTFRRYDYFEPVELQLTQKHQHRSQQPPPTIKLVERQGVKVLPELKLIKPGRPNAGTAKSSSSSGYTSDTVQDDGLELKVKHSPEGHYVKDMKRVITGRVKGIESLKAPDQKEMFYYRKPNSGLPRISHIKTL